MRRPMRSAVLALLILCWGASLVTAQTPLTRPLISEQVSPVEEISIQTQDGYDVIGVVRTPPGQGPFPAVVVVHGGLDTVPLNFLRNLALSNPTTARFLAAGYVTMIPTFRSRAEDPQTVNALWDNLAIVAYVKQMAQVDPNSVVVYGCSGGGDLALELAAEADLAAITAEEPATVLFTGMMNQRLPKSGDTFTVPDSFPLFQDPDRFYTPELQRFTQKKIAAIKSPVFIAEGDQPLGPVELHTLIDEIVIHELKAAGKEVEHSVYADQQHCFGFFGANEVAGEFFEDMHVFFKRYLPTSPTPLAASLVEYVPVAPERLVSMTASAQSVEGVWRLVEAGPEGNTSPVQGGS